MHNYTIAHIQIVNDEKKKIFHTGKLEANARHVIFFSLTYFSHGRVPRAASHRI